MAKFDPKAWINLEKARLLLLDDHAEGSSILNQIVRAFGVRRLFACKSPEEAKEYAAQDELHLVLANANLRHSSAYDFIHWLRRSRIQPNAFAPVILITGHSQVSNVRRARDCGANYVMAKPVSPQAVLERIGFVASQRKPFVSCETYLGPDRRIRDLGPPTGLPGRRYDDPSVDTDRSSDQHLTVPRQRGA